MPASWQLTRNLGVIETHSESRRHRDSLVLPASSGVTRLVGIIGRHSYHRRHKASLVISLSSGVTRITGSSYLTRIAGVFGPHSNPSSLKKYCCFQNYEIHGYIDFRIIDLDVNTTSNSDLRGMYHFLCHRARKKLPSHRFALASSIFDSVHCYRSVAKCPKTEK